MKLVIEIDVEKSEPLDHDVKEFLMEAHCATAISVQVGKNVEGNVNRVCEISSKHFRVGMEK